MWLTFIAFLPPIGLKIMCDKNQKQYASIAFCHMIYSAYKYNWIFLMKMKILSNQFIKETWVDQDVEEEQFLQQWAQRPCFQYKQAQVWKRGKWTTLLWLGLCDATYLGFSNWVSLCLFYLEISLSVITETYEDHQHQNIWWKKDGILF